MAEARLTQDHVQYVVGTGYGRVSVPFANRTITEIGCHARGAHFFFPTARIILDMGGQDCKAIRCDERGKVAQFLLNDKCAPLVPVDPWRSWHSFWKYPSQRSASVP